MNNIKYKYKCNKQLQINHSVWETYILKHILNINGQEILRIDSKHYFGAGMNGKLIWNNTVNKIKKKM